jgi:hypothetical protein
VKCFIPERDVREAAGGDMIGYIQREMEAVEKEARSG